ncbi:hypothetical protein G7K_2145-t1 [Saitoella complicata NRRL Y-17804]|uniref:Uncharacterized protein n=1 Tax=Saitoella complicata (strain BCRC 22490 / CBS 7301 / JCM 7358 / NBRC 10748 / NRRL Y-17804) TaxID=698492 RepID=A0A0E9NE27_SAICN|nr:hypothetical protein G7K_2145-t1 [Saitoella complicata NRRL Y-17804]
MKARRRKEGSVGWRAYWARISFVLGVDGVRYPGAHLCSGFLLPIFHPLHNANAAIFLNGVCNNLPIMSWYRSYGLHQPLYLACLMHQSTHTHTHNPLTPHNPP